MCVCQSDVWCVQVMMYFDHGNDLATYPEQKIQLTPKLSGLALFVRFHITSYILSEPM